MASSIGRTAQTIKVNLKTTKLTEWAAILGLTAAPIMVFGIKTRGTEKVSTFGPTADVTKVSTLTTRKRATARLNGLTVANTKDTGKTASKMGFIVIGMKTV